MSGYLKPFNEFVDNTEYLTIPHCPVPRPVSSTLDDVPMIASRHVYESTNILA